MLDLAKLHNLILLKKAKRLLGSRVPSKQQDLKVMLVLRGAGATWTALMEINEPPSTIGPTQATEKELLPGTKSRNYYVPFAETSNATSNKTNAIRIDSLKRDT